MLSPAVIVISVAFLVTLLVQLINFFMIDQIKLEKDKRRMKEIQDKLKTIKDHKSKEFGLLQEEMLDINLNMMKQQMKPMFITFLPYIILFYYMGSMFGFMPMEVGSDVLFNIQGNGFVNIPCLNINQTIYGEYKGTATIKELNCNAIIGEKNVELELSDKPIDLKDDNVHVSITPKKYVILHLPFSIPFVGNELGWLGTFLLVSIPTSITLNNIFKKVKLNGKTSTKIEK